MSTRSTEKQYKSISGHFGKYFNRLLAHKSRRADGLTKQALLEILEKQGGKCALSGIRLTCQLERGKYFPANASIDRIEAGGKYEPSNIQLVCNCLNKFRGDVSIEELAYICREVVRVYEDNQVAI